MLVVLLCAGLGLLGCGSSQHTKQQSAGSHESRINSSREPKQALLPLPTGPPLKNHSHPVPVLMYHVVSEPPNWVPYPDLFVPKSVFASHMRALASSGYRGITLDQLWEYWHSGRRLPKHPVVLTFDDGYHSVYSNALPILSQLRWPAVLNLEARIIHKSGGLTMKNVRALIAAGWEVDSHTINHLDVTKLNATQLRQETTGARKLIKQLFGVPVNFFCYPSGRLNPTAVAAVRAAGYRGATTTQYGLARPTDPYRLARVRINGTDSAAAVLAKLRALAPEPIV